MKLEEGMYVRLDTGKIGKIVYFKERDSYPYSYDRITIDSERYTRTTRNVIKASHNIIDLIEVGDYVNGYKITEIQEVNEYYPKRLLFVSFPDKSILDVFNNDNIKSIVTKEQFSQMKYKVGE